MSLGHATIIEQPMALGFTLHALPSQWRLAEPVILTCHTASGRDGRPRTSKHIQDLVQFALFKHMNYRRLANRARHSQSPTLRRPHPDLGNPSGFQNRDVRQIVISKVNPRDVAYIPRGLSAAISC